jgi:tyrosine decarboxylase MnfA
MDERGLSEEEVFEELNCFSNSNSNFRKVLSSMCTIPHPIAVKAYNQFIHSNIGDPGLFCGTAEMEKQIIKMIAGILNHPNPKDAYGHLTSGGTESNVEAVLHMKNRYMVFRDDNNFSKKLNLVLPKTAHFSFEKIANLLDIQLKKADVDSRFCVIPESVESLIDENTIGLIGIAGNTEFGEADPIEQLSEISLKYNLPLHIDAAFGGFVFPFLENSEIKFGFDVSGVTSVSVDPHKTGLSVIPAGILIFKNESFLNLSLDKVKVKTPYLTSKYQSTLTGTRPGAAVAATYAVMKHLGKEGYRKNVAYCMDLTDYFQQELDKINLQPCLTPLINIVTVCVGNYEKTDKIRSLLFEKYGWNVSATKTIPALRFVLMPHVTKEDIRSLISDLKELLDS